MTGLRRATPEAPDSGPAGSRLAILRRRWPFWALVVWTVVLWVSRMRNVLANDELSSTGRVVSIGVVVLFVAFALVAAWGFRHGRMAATWGFVIWTIGYWLVRGGGILIDGGYSIGFKAVHTVLMVISLTLAGLTAVQVSDRTPRPSR